MSHAGVSEGRSDAAGASAVPVRVLPQIQVSSGPKASYDSYVVGKPSLGLESLRV